MTKQCPKGQFWHIGNGNCYSCPSDMIRSARKIGGSKACMKIGGLVKHTTAKLMSPGKPTKDAAVHIGSGRFFTCPAGYKWNGIGIKAKKACKKVTVKFASAKSEPRGQIRNLANDLCFGAKQSNLKMGAAVIAQKCLDRDSRFQSWYMDKLSRIRPLKQVSFKKGKAGAMCLEVMADGKSKSGTKLMIERCSKSDKPSQKWFVDQDFLIHSELDAESCISFSGKGAVGSAMMTDACITDKAKKAQAWSFGSKLFKPINISADNEVDADKKPIEKGLKAATKALQKQRAKWAAQRASAAEERAAKREAKKAAKKKKKAKKVAKKVAKKEKKAAKKADKKICTVCFYDKAGYKGTSQCATKKANVPDLNPAKLSNKVSSIKFTSTGNACKKAKLYLYKGKKYKSSLTLITKNVKNLSKRKG